MEVIRNKAVVVQVTIKTNGNLASIKFPLAMVTSSISKSMEV